MITGISILPHNDIHLDAAGNLAMATGADAIAQHVRQRLKAWKGEWFLNLDAGVDWMFFVFDRQPSEKDIGDGAIKAEILATPGVTDILEYSSFYDRANRGIFVDRVVIETIYGEASLSI